MAQRTPYVILLESVNTGKPSLMKKLTGSTEKNSGGTILPTEIYKHFESDYGSLKICYTQEIDFINDQLQENIEIAHALNFMDVDLVLITVKASEDIASVGKDIENYRNNAFIKEFPKNLIRFCIIHMDEDKSLEEKLADYLKSDLGIPKVFSSSPEKESHALIKEIREDCLSKEPVSISVDETLFSKLFKINTDDKEILKKSQKEVKRFQKMTQDFYCEWENYPESEQIDSIFEFQTLMSDKIETTNWNNYPDNKRKADHITILIDQLSQTFFDVTLKAKEYHGKMKADFCKCPYCGEIWENLERFEGDTTCGENSCKNQKHYQDSLVRMANFSFSWNESHNKLSITKNTRKEIPCNEDKSGNEMKTFGCGKKVNWFKMSPFNAPKEFVANCIASAEEEKRKFIFCKMWP